MKSIVLSKGKVAIVDKEDYDLLNIHKWSCSTAGYAVRRKDGRVVYMHREIMGSPSGMEVDHRDNDTLNCQRDNLRICPHRNNSKSQKKRKDRAYTSKYKGVFFDKNRNKWRAEITVDYKNKYLGRFKTEKEAAIAYNKAAVKYFMSFAKINNMNNDKCLVNFASTGRELYCKAQLRLIKSFVSNGWNGDYLIRSTDSYVDEYDGVKILLGSLPTTEKYGRSYNHEEINYGFKLYLIWEAYEKGYRKILWCDSTITLVGDLQSCWDHAKEHGVCAFDNMGHPLKFWVTDIALERSGVSVSQLENMKQIMCCSVFFDFDNHVALEIFEEWMKMCRDGESFSMKNGSSRPGYRGHRGDQPCLSLILGKRNIPLLPYGPLCYEPHDKTKEYGEPVLVNRGIM